MTVIDFKSKTREKPKKEIPPWPGLTLPALAKQKGLSQLAMECIFGVYQTTYQGKNLVNRGKPVVAFPYGLDVNGQWVRTGTKIRGGSSHQTEWLKGGHDKYIPAPYICRGLQNCLDLALVEGESDTMTLAFYGFAALGISGVDNWKPEFAQLPVIQNAERIFIFKEPDQGERFVKKISKDLLGAKAEKIVISFQADAPDVNALHFQCQQQLPTDYIDETFLEEEEERLAQAMRVRAYRRAMFLKEFNTLLEKAHVADRFRFGDSGNAERLVARFGENLRFDLDRKKFVIWNDSIWKREDDLALLPLTKEIARSIDDPDWAQKAESAGARNAMITLTKGEHTIWARLEDFDKHPMLLNVKNGTLDLETGNLRSFCREDFMTLQCRVEFDKAATCPKFDKFLQFICNNDKDIIHDMRKALGYTLTGTGSSHVFFMLLGGGANGKTQLIEILSLLLGSGYSQAASMKLFAESKSGFESADYAFVNFFNARLVHAAEPKRTATLNENRLKEVSGGDTISVRQIYEREFEYKPTWKLWMMMNHDPRIVGTDEGIWRRVRVVRFTQTVPEKDRIEDYGAKLFNEEGPGILNRLLEGVRDWKAEGIPTAAFGGESLKYRSSQDAIQRFIDECCVIGDQNIHVKCGTLYDAFAKWARTNHELEFSLQAFSQTLESKYPKKRVHDDGEHRFGIGLKDARV